MKAFVVYESFWGNTASVARAIAEGIGEGTVAVTTEQATPDALAGVELLVVGAPLLGFSLPTEQMREGLPGTPGAPSRADVDHPSIRSWASGLPSGTAPFAAFETRIWWSPGSAAGLLAKILGAKGYREVGPRLKALVTGRFGPLKDGELDRAREWGASLTRPVAS